MNTDPVDITELKNEQNQRRDLGFLRESWNQVRLIGRLLKDREVPLLLKAIPLFTVAYLFFPIDFVPDTFLGLGQLDDIGVLLLGSRMFTELAPTHLVEAHRLAILEADGYTMISDGESSQVIEAIVLEPDKRN